DLRIKSTGPLNRFDALHCKRRQERRGKETREAGSDAMAVDEFARFDRQRTANRDLPLRQRCSRRASRGAYGDGLDPRNLVENLVELLQALVLNLIVRNKNGSGR